MPMRDLATAVERDKGCNRLQLKRQDAKEHAADRNRCPRVGEHIQVILESR